MICNFNKKYISFDNLLLTLQVEIKINEVMRFVILN